MHIIATQSSLAPVKSRTVYLSGADLPRLSSSSSSSSSTAYYFGVEGLKNFNSSKCINVN